jgi:hypothetical protein
MIRKGWEHGCPPRIGEDYNKNRSRAILLRGQFWKKNMAAMTGRNLLRFEVAITIF